MPFRLVATLLFALLSPFCRVDALQFDPQYPVFRGEPVRLNALPGKQAIYLKFWASWCPDCRRELPALEKAYQQYHQDFAMFAVKLNINETDEAIATLQQQSGLTMPIVLDQNGSIASHFDFKDTPFHVLIDASGKVVYTTYRDDARLAAKPQQLASSSAVAGPAEAGPCSAKNAAEKATPAFAGGLQIVYFSATWCDSYMPDVEQHIAQNCARAQQVVDSLYSDNPQLPLHAYLTHLWTEAPGAGL